MKSNLQKLLLMSCKFIFYGIFLQFMFAGILLAHEGNAQDNKSVKQVYISLQMRNAGIVDVFRDIESKTDFKFFYDRKIIDRDLKISFNSRNIAVHDILIEVSKRAKLRFKQVNNTINVKQNENGFIKPEKAIEIEIQTRNISGSVTSDEDGEGIPGVNVIEKGTTNGTVTNLEGEYSLEVSEGATLVFSSVGYSTEEVEIGSRSVIDVVMSEDVKQLEELVVVGYGTMKKRDLTGSVSQISEESVEDRANISVTEALQGAVPGLNVGQVNTVGGQPSLSIRGRTSISGEQSPLIVLDGVIFRGRLIDINPNDIKSIDVLKDASSTAIYGSQATNGVVLITTKSGEVSDEPTISYSGNYSFQEPTKRFETESPEEYLQRVEAAYFFDSRTEESGYLEPNNTWEITSVFPTPEQVEAYQNNRPTDWYNLLTNDRMYFHSHNLSMMQRSERSGYFISLGYTGQQGFMINDDYSRLNARVNLDNSITDWLKIGIQSFLTSSDYSGIDISPFEVYNQSPFAPAYHEDGSLVTSPNSTTLNPLYIKDSDNLDKRLNLFGNLYAELDIPFIEGLNFSTNYFTNSFYIFQDFANNFTGRGAKNEGRRTEWINDNILTYKRDFNDVHEINAMAGYGREKREFTYTGAVATDFNSPVLGYNNLQSGNAELQSVSSDAWMETSLYYMARLHYNYDSKYFITGTIRRDGFSGFSEKNKYGTFPSFAVGWDAAKESFLNTNVLRVFDQFKLRASYGSNGNRTIGRYQTLAKIGEGFRYVDENGESVYAKGISSLASPNLKWETTTGFNFGLDYAFLNYRISGSIEYYNNNTTDLLYNVDIPGISRFETFPDNLGKMHNSGVELLVSSYNINQGNFEWRTNFVFSRVRNELKELLGFDNDGDGKEDDLVSEGLFIGESLGTIFDYYTDGELWQFGDEIPATAGVGSFKIEDVNDDGVIDPDDRKIIGHSEPAFRFSIGNDFKYKNWELSIFVNSVQGNDNYYLGRDIFEQVYPNSTAWDRDLFPKGIDFWLPENPNATYQRLGVEIAGGLRAFRYMPRSFVRLQDVNLAYNVNADLLNRLNIHKLKVFFHGKNLLTLTKWRGWDPETGEGITMGGRPVTRNFTFGLNISL